MSPKHVQILDETYLHFSKIKTTYPEATYPEATLQFSFFLSFSFSFFLSFFLLGNFKIGYSFGIITVWLLKLFL
jgi:hypothetical protein